MLGLILYGSRARGDHRLNSDVDLLGITDSGAIRRTKPARGTNLHLFPFKKLREDAAKGELFLSHLVHEGRVVFDPCDLFEIVRADFQFKQSYASEIRQGTEVALFLISNKSRLDQNFVRKRLVWAIRTMIIARAANDSLPIFGLKDLMKFSGIDALKIVIGRSNVADVDDLIKVSRQVLIKMGDHECVSSWPKGKLAQIARLSDFSIGRSTASMVFPGASDHLYNEDSSHYG